MLGGSFNPAHEGHLFVSHLALERLGLDQVWWLVSPQNPLKPVEGMAPLEERLSAARHFVEDRRIVVTDIERMLGTHYTADTLRVLTRRARAARFVWLMGADNLANVHRWHRWETIFATVPVAVFDRAPYSFSCLASRAAVRFRARRLPPRKARTLASRTPPAWTYVIGPRHPASASAIRAGEKSFGFARQEGATAEGGVPFLVATPSGTAP